MVNSEQFAGRLQKIMDFYDISAAVFAETIEVGRSSISHILSGRNKPSLDFVMKVVQTYPEVELYWLLNGKGSFPPSPKKIPERELIEKNEKDPDVPGGSKISGNTDELPPFKPGVNKKIRKIILLYEDGTFESFEN